MNCCTGNCRQGRDCPKRKPQPLLGNSDVAALWGLMVADVVVVLLAMAGLVAVFG